MLFLPDVYVPLMTYQKMVDRKDGNRWEVFVH